MEGAVGPSETVAGAMSDGDVLALELDLSWIRDDRGRMVRARTPEHRPAPLLVVGTAEDGSGRVWAASTAVPDPVVEAVPDAIADRGDPTDRLLALLSSHGPVERETAYVIDRPPSPPPGIDVRTSADDDAAAVAALVPAADRDLTPPWAIALVDGEVAAVCESARLVPAAAAAGVWTYPDHRRKGLAVAVVGTWAGLVDGTALYGHDDTNRASAGVARRIGARRFGRWVWVR